MGNYRLGLDDYLEHICRAEAAMRSLVTGSLNGVSTGG